jgi:hypothetical protein
MYMEKMLTARRNKSPYKKVDRELLLTVSLFLLNQEELRKLLWTVKSVNYSKVDQIVKIGISTTNGKMGTTLSKLRKTSKYLSDYLYDQGVTFRKTQVKFFVEKEDIEIERLFNLISKTESN